MKIFGGLIVALMLAVHAEAITKAEQKAMLIGAAQECKITESASDDDMGRLVEKKPPTTHEGKCLFACIMEQMDMIQDGKINKEGVLEFAEVFVAGDAGKMKIAGDLVSECAAIVDSDRCELAVKAGGCLKMGAMKNNMDFDL